MSLWNSLIWQSVEIDNPHKHIQSTLYYRVQILIHVCIPTAQGPSHPIKQKLPSSIICTSSQWSRSSLRPNCDHAEMWKSFQEKRKGGGISKNGWEGRVCEEILVGPNSQECSQYKIYNAWLLPQKKKKKKKNRQNSSALVCSSVQWPKNRQLERGADCFPTLWIEPHSFTRLTPSLSFLP